MERFNGESSNSNPALVGQTTWICDCCWSVLWHPSRGQFRLWRCALLRTRARPAHL